MVSPRDSEFDGSLVVETETMVLFWQPPGIFGQWTLSPFEVEGERYGCAEQFMMAEKARLFGDESTRRRILMSPSPKEQKALGRAVRGFVQTAWEAERLGVVVQGNLAKFSQNPAMGDALLATGTKLLVEASPIDRVWGVGLRADDARVLDRSTWLGQNLLGEALMVVRTLMRADARRHVLCEHERATIVSK